MRGLVNALFTSLSVDISFKDDATGILLVGVSFTRMTTVSCRDKIKDRVKGTGSPFIIHIFDKNEVLSLTKNLYWFCFSKMGVSIEVKMKTY